MLFAQYPQNVASGLEGRLEPIIEVYVPNSSQRTMDCGFLAN